MKYKAGDIITTVNAYGTGGVDVVVKVGRRYLSVRPFGRPESWGSSRLDIEDASRIILPGDRSEVCDRLRQLNQEEREANDQRYSDRHAAIWEFERQWDAEHPYPANALGDYIAELKRDASNEH